MGQIATGGGAGVRDWRRNARGRERDEMEVGAEVAGGFYGSGQLGPCFHRSWLDNVQRLDRHVECLTDPIKSLGMWGQVVTVRSPGQCCDRDRWIGECVLYGRYLPLLFPLTTRQSHDPSVNIPSLSTVPLRCTGRYRRM
jgi:hypothetical protein